RWRAGCWRLISGLTGTCARKWQRFFLHKEEGFPRQRRFYQNPPGAVGWRTAMQGKEAVVFKGSRAGISVQVDPEAPFGAVVEELRRKLSAAENFFQGATVRIELGNRQPDTVEQRVLRELIEAHGLTVVDDDPAAVKRVSNGKPRRTATEAPASSGRGAHEPAGE